MLLWSVVLSANNDQGTNLWNADLTHSIKENVIAAFKEFHKCGVCHGDGRTTNIIVTFDGFVMVIDFEQSFVIVDKVMLLEEEDEVQSLLQVKKMIHVEKI